MKQRTTLRLLNSLSKDETKDNFKTAQSSIKLIRNSTKKKVEHATKLSNRKSKFENILSP